MRRTSLALLLILPHWLHAQTRLGDVRVGARIRVTAPSAVAGRYDALIAARRVDTLVLVSSGMPAVELPLSAVTEAELFTGKSVSAGAWRGAKIGALVGGILGLLVIAGASEDYCEATDPSCVQTSDLEDFAIMTTLGVVQGAVVGAIVRAAQWQRLDVTSSRVSLIGPSRSGAQIGLRIAVQ